MPTVAVCEDDSALRSALARALRREGYDVLVAADGGELLRVCAKQIPHLVVLDLGLPDSDGRDVCLALRSQGIDSPVLMLTALDGLHHKVTGFEAGADDYLTKPFDLVELLARAEALLRRRTAHVKSDSGIVLDPTGHRMTCGHLEVDLTPTEFRLLARLLGSPREVIRRHALVAAAWPHGARVSDNTLDSYLRRIRVKLEAVGVSDRIGTVRGVGYRWR